MAPHGYVSIVLHAHLPFVRHPENPFHLEEMWFFEAMHETYLPLLKMLRRLEDSEIPGKLTISISAPLLAMMTDRLLIQRFEEHLDKLIDLTNSEIRRTRHDPDLAPLAEFYKTRFTNLRRFFVDDVQRNIVAEFTRFHDAGRIELITCVGTHGFLPLIDTEASKRAQVKASCDYFELLTGNKPRGIWLAECAYTPGVDRYLHDNGINFSFVEGRAVEQADARPVYGNYAPVVSKEGVAFFGRDQLASAQVWSASEGYPGDYNYREFYRDIGFDLDEDYIGPWIHPDGIRINTGLKYHRITGDVDLMQKDLYNPERAFERAWDHGRHFVEQRAEQIRALEEPMGGRPPHITCPYDAELYGHWWFEGPTFLEAVFHHAQKHPEVVLGTPPDYLDEVDVQQRTNPAISSWGEESYFSVWLDESNAWIYRYLHNAEHLMEQMVRDNRSAHGATARAIRQAGRELLLAQASDWAFIMKTGTSVGYAVARTEQHIENFQKLFEQVTRGEIDEDFVEDLELKNPIFPDLDWQAWSA
jgi:1,4-alpha-glucan branching enzyme